MNITRDLCDYLAGLTADRLDQDLLCLLYTSGYEAISVGDELMMEDAPGQLLGGDGTVRLRNLTTGRDIPGTVSFTDKELELLLAGGLLPYIHNRHNGGVKP